jgi:hypothetical protein
VVQLEDQALHQPYGEFYYHHLHVALDKRSGTKSLTSECARERGEKFEYWVRVFTCCRCGHRERTFLPMNFERKLDKAHRKISKLLSLRRGNCYVTSEALYHLLGGKAAGWTVKRLKVPGDTHWFLQHESGVVLDATQAQFDVKLDYSKAVSTGFFDQKALKTGSDPHGSHVMAVIRRIRDFLLDRDEAGVSAHQKLDKIVALLTEVKQMDTTTKAALDALTASVAAETSVTQSAVALLNGLAAQIAALKDQVADPAVAAQIQAFGRLGQSADERSGPGCDGQHASRLTFWSLQTPGRKSLHAIGVQAAGQCVKLPTNLSA